MVEPRPTSLIPGLGAALLLLAVIPYLQTLGHGFVIYDDNLYITENAVVLRGMTLNGLGWAFTTLHASNWHPLTWLSHMLDCSLFRRADGTQWPGGHHLVNVLLHAVNTLFVWLVFRRMTGAIWRPALVAALFAVHPLHTESVAWIAERKDVLSTLFGLLAIWCYANWVRDRSVPAYLLMLAWYAMSLMAKPMMVTLPCVLLLLDYWPLRRWPGQVVQESAVPPTPHAASWPRLVLEKIPLLAMSVASSIITVMAQNTGEALQSLGNVPMSSRIANAVIALAAYLGKAVWPVNLAVLYPSRVETPALTVVLCGLLLLTISALTIWQRRQRPWLIVGWLFFLGTLVPVIGLVQVGMQSMADRYTYVPLVGVFIMIAWCLPFASLGWRRASILLVSLMLAAFASVTWVQIRHWRDDFTLFGRTLSVTNNNFIAHNNLGHALARADQLEEAIREFNQAIAIKSDYAAAQENLGSVLVRSGRAHEAIPHFEAALKKQPNTVRILSGLGGALDAAGRPEEAMAAYRRALDIDANAADVHADLGVALARQNRTAEAIAEYQIAMRLKPGDAQVHANLGLALATEGRLDEAIVLFQEALRLKPDFAQASEYLKVALDQKSQGSRKQ